jgi:hypothetical protein
MTANFFGNLALVYANWYRWRDDKVPVFNGGASAQHATALINTRMVSMAEERTAIIKGVTKRESRK